MVGIKLRLDLPEMMPQVFSTVIGKPQTENSSLKEFYIGDKAESKGSILSLKYPIQNGIISNWDDMEKIWHYIFHDELKVPPEDYPVLLTENALNPKINREYMTQVMFETFNSPAIYVSVPAVLSFYDFGKITGITIDIGEGLCTVVPIYDGHVLFHAIKQQNLAGNDITKYLQSLLQSRATIFLSKATEIEKVRNIKESLCQVSFDFDKEINQTSAPESSVKRTCKFPNGQVLTVDKERFLAPEILFKPYLSGLHEKGIHQTVYDSIKACDMDVRRDLVCTTIMSGGSTMFPGIAERLHKELSALMLPSLPLRVIAPPERTLSAWIGGSILTSLLLFQQQWVRKEEYEECGPSIIHKTQFPLFV